MALKRPPVDMALPAVEDGRPHFHYISAGTSTLRQTANLKSSYRIRRNTGTIEFHPEGISSVSGSIGVELFDMKRRCRQKTSNQAR